MKTRRALDAAAGILATLTVAGATACGGGSSADASASDAATEKQFTSSVRAVNESGAAGSLMISGAGDSLTVKLEVLGLKNGPSYPTRIRTGTCSGEGEAVAQLAPFTVASVGLGSSLTDVARSKLESGASYAAVVESPEGQVIACAPVEPPSGG